MAEEILSDEAGSFPWSVLHDRHPALIEKVRTGLPYPPDRRRALDELAEEITGPILPWAGDPVWTERVREHVGKTWYEAPFLWAESYFYRRLLDAVGYFAPGPWRGVDPFEPFKSAELNTSELAADLARYASAPPDALLHASVWGNRADLGFSITSAAASGGDLLVDDSARLWSAIGAVPGTVCVVADNAARELVPDLLLADHLLRSGLATSVVLHVKPYPYYVSDAMTADVVAAVRRLTDLPAGARLWQAMADGDLVLRAHEFSCAPWSYHRMPADLAAEFAAAAVTIMKGDLNYRRLVGDRHWPATTPFDEVTAYFPGPVAALRTCKSDVATGIPADVVARLDETDERWRTNGAHAVIQFSG